MNNTHFHCRNCRWTFEKADPLHGAGGLCALCESQLNYPVPHWLLVAATECRPDLASQRANYLTAWQLSLDLNQSSESRGCHEAQCNVARAALVAALRNT